MSGRPSIHIFKLHYAACYASISMKQLFAVADLMDLHERGFNASSNFQVASCLVKFAYGCININRRARRPQRWNVCCSPVYHSRKVLQSAAPTTLGQVRVGRGNYVPGQLTEVVIRDRPKRRDASRLVNPEEKKP